jgi:DNA repair exonuclease SbcCD ATPase subunit
MENANSIKISPYSKIKVYWDDRPENYSKEAKNKIKNHFAKKYGVNKNNIDVIYRPVKFNDNGDAIEVNGATIENIMDLNYQRELMKEWIKREDKKIDFERILKLDDKVNGELNLENNDIQHNTWAIKWLMIDNFLSFGENNYLPLSKLRGLNVVNSLPANQGGKTTLTIDAVKFLLHGNTTKTDKNEEVFNQFTEKNELVVRGMIEIAGEETIIERKMKRSAKKGGGWTVTNRVNYYKLLPDGEEEMLNEEDATRTTSKVRATIGSEKDFEMLVLATEKNLEDLIGLTTSESGKVLTRLIGLEIIEMKEAIVRRMYNDFNSKKKSNEYDVVTLSNDIEEHTEKISMGNTAKNNLEDDLTERKREIKILEDENDRLLNSKITVDVVITTMNPSKLEKEINEITESGLKLKEKIDGINKSIDNIGNIIFDEDEHYRLNKEHNEVQTNIRIKQSEIKRLESVVTDLIDGGICKACNRKLDDVDNTEHINAHQKSIANLLKEIEELRGIETEIKSELSALNDNKLLIDEKNKLELSRDRVEVEMGSLRNEIVAKKSDLKKYKINQEAIELNRKIDSEVSMVKTNLEIKNREKDSTITKIEKVKQEIESNENSIDVKKKLIEQIKKEEEIERIYKVYIELVGKKGISKLVLRSVLPIINSEVQRLLEDVCDFEIEIFIDDKNDVQFLLNKDGISKHLKSGSGFEKTASSLALRAILGKLSTLPMPNFITFDEVLGKVANENLEKLKPLFDKIKNMYEIVFLITHNDIVKDWSKNIVTIVKENNVSKLTFNK